MERWLETVCAIAANDMGARANQVRFLLNDFMDLAHAAYNEGTPAACFALEFTSLLGLA